MKDLRTKILLFTATALAFLIIHVVGYVYNINVFRNQLEVLDISHYFMEDVLELRRYEKNFLYYKELKDLDEILKYIQKIKTTLQKIEKEDLFQGIAEKFVNFHKKLDEYETLLNNYKNDKCLNPEKIRHYGQEILSFAEHILKTNKEYIRDTLNKILFIPTIVTILFGGTLILLLIVLAHTILKQISFIQSVTDRIAKGDFSYISEDTEGGTTFSVIIKAFNRMIRELDERQNALIQAKKLSAVGTLVSGIAHELNNPLNNISLTAEAILEEFEDLEKEEIEEMLNEILGEAKRASSVVKNLLDFSRRKNEDVKEIIKIRELIDSTIKLVKNQLMISDIQLIREVPTDLPNIMGNVDNLKQVFVNLFLNAIQAMPDGGYLKISAKPVDKYVRIDVEDSGIGMPPEVMERIFDPFFSTKPVGKGTGLGLSIVYGIIKKHGGYIEVNSKQGKGTTFTVYLPIYSPTPSEEK